MTAEEPVFDLVYVAGPAHSGSTLLNMLLNGHPEFLGLSEVDRLRTVEDAPQRVAEEMERDLWIGVRGEVEAAGHQLAGNDFGRRWGRYAALVLGRRAAPSDLDRALFAAIARRVDARWLVDASKSSRRLANLLATFPDRRIVVVHLTRDGRGVMYSHRRMDYGRLRSLRNWLLEQTTLPLLRLATRRRENVTWVSMRYESLATATREQLEAVFAACGTSYHPAVDDFWDAPFVGVGGNTMRFRREPVRLDERWRGGLDARDRAVFLAVGWWLNRLYGYRWGGSRSDDGAPSRP